MFAITLSDRDFSGAAAIGDGWRGACEHLGADGLSGDAHILSDGEQARLRAMRAQPAAALRRTAHIHKRRAVAARLGIAPEAVTFGPPGAPLADGSFLSLSHADGAVAVALCTAPVGVDIEPVRDRGDHARLARRFFAPEEARALDALAPADAAVAFAWRWTAKEALLKATGMRPGEALATAIPVGTAPFATAVKGARLLVFAPAPGFVCAVAQAPLPTVPDHRTART